jgi:hypothetical protein
VKVFVRGGRPFRILGIDGQGDGLTAEARPDAAATHVLTVKMDPKQAGRVQKTLTVRTDLGGATAVLKVDATVSQ